MESHGHLSPRQMAQEVGPRKGDERTKQILDLQVAVSGQIPVKIMSKIIVMFGWRDGWGALTRMSGFKRRAICKQSAQEWCKTRWDRHSILLLTLAWLGFTLTPIIWWMKSARLTINSQLCGLTLESPACQDGLDAGHGLWGGMVW